MGLLDLLKTSKLGLKGKTPPTRAGAKSTSQLHVQGTEKLTIRPDESNLDLDGKTPSRYLDNPPQ